MPGEQKSIVLILSRELAANLEIPAFVIDDAGALVFFNEAAASVLGRTFGETGALPAAEWGTTWDPRRDDGSPYATDDLPIVRASAERRPAHGTMTIDAGDGVRRSIEVTAFPLLATGEELAGALAFFWERTDG